MNYFLFSRYISLFFLIIALSCSLSSVNFGQQNIDATLNFLSIPTQEKPFVILIPSYNNARWFQKNIDSAVKQSYNNFRIIYVDDCSMDNTGDLVEEYIRTNNLEHKVTLIKNTYRKGALANLYEMIHSCKDEEIMVTLDGDDWLSHPQVLTYLNATYQDTHFGKIPWITYGQYVKFPHNHTGGSRKIPDEVISSNAIRNYEWVTSHLRTFYAWLFKKIKREDLIWRNDEFYPTAWDNAFMLPMIEMAGFHSRFISEILYIYNLTNPISDHVIHAQSVGVCYNMIRSKPPYEPLTDQEMPIFEELLTTTP